MSVWAHLEDGRRLEFPDGTDPAVVQATVKKVLGAAPAPQQPLPRTPVKPPQELTFAEKYIAPALEMATGGANPIGDSSRQTLTDLAAGASGLMRGSLNLASEGLGQKVFPTSGANESSGARTTGELLDPVAMVTAAKILKYLPYAKVLPSKLKPLEAGPPAPFMLSQAAMATAKNIAGGGAIGGTVGGLSDQGDATSGALLGSALNVLGTPVLQAAGKGIGKVADVLSAKYQAAKMLREGGMTPAAHEAARVSPDDLTAVQALEEAGLNKDVLSAAGDFAARMDKQNFFADKMAMQRAAQIRAVQEIAGGENQAQVAQSARKNRQSLNAQWKPLLQEVEEAANTAGTTGARLQAEADRLGGAATSKVEDVRRVSAAQQKAQDLADAGKMTIGRDAPRGPGRYSYGQELADIGERTAQKSADDSLILGEGRNFAQSRADSIGAHGLRPLQVDSLISHIEGVINAPGTRRDKIQVKVLTEVLDELKKAKADGGGAVDFRDLQKIREVGVSNAITSAVGTSLDPKGQKAMAASLLTSLKPHIDEAIENAIGNDKSWVKWLNEQHKGRKLINRQEMAGQLLENLRTGNDDAFIALATNNAPKKVGKLFQGEVDVSDAMGEKHTKTIQDIANAMIRDKSIKEKAARGVGGWDELISGYTSRVTLPNWINAKIAVTNRGLSMLEQRLGKQMRNNIYEAMKSGKTLAALLDTLPAADRSAVLKVMMDAQTSAFPIGGVVSALEARQ